MVAFGGTRTYHRLACAIEDAGWEIRDQIGWVYSSGFPKSMDISKAIDKKLGAERASRGGVGEHEGNIDFGMKNRCPKCGKPFFSANPCTCPRDDLVPITEEAKKWSGWGTCLKPAFEPIVLARKPLDGTAVENVMKHGVGGLNIDECRVPSDEPVVVHSPARATLYDSGHNNMGTWVDNRGRFPANIIHDGSEEVMDAFDNKLTPDVTPIVLARKPLDGTVADNVLKHGVGGLNIEECRVPTTDNLNGGAYSKNGNRGNLAGDERDDKGAGMFAPGKTVGKDFTQPTGRFPANIIHDGSDEVLEVFPDNVKGGTWNRTKGARPFNNNGKATEFENHGSDKSIGSAARFFYCAKASKREKGEGNTHPTVKPIALMEYLVKLVSPKGAKVMDPFMGSGSTGIAALNLGRNFIGIEKEPEYFNIAKGRIEGVFQKTNNVV